MKRLFLSLAMFFTAATSPGAITDVDWTDLGPHPRLFARADEWAALPAKIASDPTSAKLHALILKLADHSVDLPTIVFPANPNSTRSLQQAREAQARIVSMAYAYRMTGHAPYLASCKREMNSIITLPNWNPNTFLDCAETVLAMAVGYDWLHEWLTPAERTSYENAILNLGLAPANNPTYDDWWYRTNNWNQVCYGGTLAGGIAIAERNPALVAAIAERAVASVHHAAAAYAPSGAYPEGPTYWEYGTTYHAILLANFQSALGDTFGLDAFPGFLDTATFFRQTATATGGHNNYGDSGDHPRTIAPAVFWFSRRNADRSLTNENLGHIDAFTAEAASVPDIFAIKDTKYNRFLPYSIFWWNPALPDTGAQPTTSYYSGGTMPYAPHRTSWTDPLAAYLSIKGGSADQSHAHMDVGSFMLEADGVRWAHDLGQENYDALLAAGINLWHGAQNSTRWSVFSIGSASHNIMRFNGAQQRVSGHAALVSHTGSGDTRGTKFNLSAVYNDQISAYSREATLRHSDRAMTIRDEWTAQSGKSAAAQWQMLTYATAITPDATGITLSQGGATLRLDITSSRPFTTTVTDVSTPPNSYERPNPGAKMIRVGFTTPAGASDFIQVNALPQGIAPPPAPVGFQAAPTAAGQVRLSWTSPASASLPVEIEHEGSAGFTPLAVITSGATTFTTTALPPGKNHRFRIRATNAAGPSDWAVSAVVATPGAILTLGPEADAHVRGETYATQNYGSSPTMTVKEDSGQNYDRNAYLRFALAAAPAGVERAFLQLRIVAGGTDPANVIVAARAVADDTWSEAALTWNTQPAFGTTLDSRTGFALAQEAEFAVTPAAQNALAGDRKLSIGLTATNVIASQRYLDFASRENPAADARPRLILHYPAGSFEAWQVNRFTLAQLGDPQLSGETADPDRDGLANLLEYALARDPMISSAASATSCAVNDGRLDFNFIRPADASDLTYTVESSGTLAASGWTAIARGSGGSPVEALEAGTLVSETDIEPGESVTVSIPASGTALFLRLKVTRP